MLKQLTNITRKNKMNINKIKSEIKKGKEFIKYNSERPFIIKIAKEEVKELEQDLKALEFANKLNKEN